MEQRRPPAWVPGLFCTQDQLLPLDQLVVERERFKFIHENQGVWSCETMINQADPPVFSDAAAVDGGDDGMREVCPTLSHFLTTFCLHELAFGSRQLYCVDSQPDHPGNLVKGDLQPLWLDGMYAYEGAKYSFYLCGPDLLLMCTGIGDYWLAFNNVAAGCLVDTSHKIRRIS
jgi:hypothetical protein